MNPQIQELIQRVLSNEMPIDVFYARMGQLGILPGEAQTMLSNSAGGSPQGMDESLSTQQAPLSAADAATASAFRGAGLGETPPAGTPSMSRPMTQEEIVLARPVEQRTPLIPRMVQRAQQIAQDARRGLTTESSTPSPQVSYSSPSAGASAGSQVATAIPQAAPVAQPQAATGSYYGLDGSEMSPTYGQQMYQPNENRQYPSTVERALSVSRGSPRAEVSSAQMPAAQSADASGIASFLRGRFGEAAKGSAMEDRLTAAQEARDRMGEGRASGGSVDGKPQKDAALHKALEIIHHLISTR